MSKEKIETCVIKNDAFTGQARAIPVKKIKKMKKRKKMIACVAAVMLCLTTGLTATAVITHLHKVSQTQAQLAAREEENTRMQAQLTEANNRIGSLENELAETIEANTPVAITAQDVSEKLSLLGTLPTYNYEYTGTCSGTNTKQLMGYDIPGTSSNVDVSYKGIIQAGFRTAEMSFSIDEDSKTITVNIPNPVILNNYLVMDDYKSIGGTNPMNRVGNYDTADLTSDIEDSELDKAINNGLYEKATAQLESVITNYLACFEDYTVEFTTNA